MKKKLQKMIVGLSACSLLPAVAACARSSEDYVKAYAAAVDEADYTQANAALDEARRAERFDLAPFVNATDQAVDRLAQSYKAGALSYDAAVIRLEQLTKDTAIKEAIGERLLSAKQIISGDSEAESLLALAQIHAEAMDFHSAIETYDAVLGLQPENQSVKEKRDQAVKQYTTELDKEIRQLIDDAYYRTAEVKVKEALSLDAHNEVFLKRQTEISAAVQAREKEIKEAGYSYEFNLRLNNYRLKEAEDFILWLKARGQDTTEMQKALAEKKTSHIQLILDRAAKAGEAAFGERWTGGPYLAAEAVINEGLALYPDNEQLLAAKKRYGSMNPDNGIDDLISYNANVSMATRGTDAQGYVYRSINYNTPLLLKPNAEFVMSMGDFTRTRVLIAPKTDDIGVYKDLEIVISVGETLLYAGNPFAERIQIFDQTYTLTQNAKLKVTVNQSGIKSFLSGIAGRNQMFVELFRY